MGTEQPGGAVSLRCGTDSGRGSERPEPCAHIAVCREYVPETSEYLVSRQRLGELLPVRLWRLQRKLPGLPSRAGSQHHEFLHTGRVSHHLRLLHVFQYPGELHAHMDERGMGGVSWYDCFIATIVS